MISSRQSTNTIVRLTSMPRIALALALVCSLFLGHAQPAAADGAASTRNIILGSAAVAAAVILASNPHTNVRANVIVGGTADGGHVYGDGRVLYPNGDVLYVSDGRGRPCGWAYGLPRCRDHIVAYYPRSYRGHRHDRYNRYDDYHHNRHHHHDHE
ncbi:MAG TPA: hypothetical protein VGD50_00575 [Candidatus Baltobacteraceae bacterium]